MKIDRPIISNIPDSITEKTDTTEKSPGSATDQTATEPVQLQRSPLPKTDTVEMKTDSLYNFDARGTGPTLDPSKTNIANAKGIPATSIPGVPFREKVELPKTFPNGSSVDGGVGSGDLGFGRKRTGPNHTGIDLKGGGTEVRNQLDNALKLREGSQGSQSSPPSSDTVNYTGLGTGRKTEGKYDAGFNRPGMGLISADKDGKDTPSKAKNVVDKVIDYIRDVAVAKFGPPGAGEALTILDAPGKVQEVTGDANDLPRGISAAMYPESRLDKIYQQGDDNKYVNPDAPEGTQPPVITDEMLDRVGVRLGSNKQPVPDEYLQDEIDGKILSGSDPRRRLISNPLPEDSNQTSLASGDAIDVIQDAKGPDTVNPNDPDLGTGGEPIIIDPNRPR